MKRWLLECCPPLRWDNMRDVGKVFLPIGLMLQRMDYTPEEGIELRFMTNEISDRTEPAFQEIVAKYGGRVISYRENYYGVRLGVRYDAFFCVDREGKENTEVVACVSPPGGKQVYGEVVSGNILRGFARALTRRGYEAFPRSQEETTIYISKLEDYMRPLG